LQVEHSSEKSNLEASLGNYITQLDSMQKLLNESCEALVTKDRRIAHLEETHRQRLEADEQKYKSMLTTFQAQVKHLSEQIDEFEEENRRFKARPQAILGPSSSLAQPLPRQTAELLGELEAFKSLHSQLQAALEELRGEKDMWENRVFELEQALQGANRELKQGSEQCDQKLPNVNSAIEYL